jgi:hypothetical protein
VIIEFRDIFLRWAETWPILNGDDKLGRTIESISCVAPAVEKGERLAETVSRTT